VEQKGLVPQWGSSALKSRKHQTQRANSGLGVKNGWNWSWSTKK